MSKWPGPPDWEPYFEEREPGVWVSKEKRPRRVIPQTDMSPEGEKQFRFVMEVLMPLILVPGSILFFFWLLHVIGD